MHLMIKSINHVRIQNTECKNCLNLVKTVDTTVKKLCPLFHLRGKITCVKSSAQTAWLTCHSVTSKSCQFDYFGKQ